MLLTIHFIWPLVFAAFSTGIKVLTQIIKLTLVAPLIKKVMVIGPLKIYIYIDFVLVVFG